MKTLVVADPRTFDGNPYEVAGRAVRQSQAVATILTGMVEDAYVMARNAQMERDLAATGSCDAPGYDDSAEGKRFADVKAALEQTERNLKILAQAAGFDPKAPLNG